MPNAALEKSGTDRGDNESAGQEQDCVAVEEGDTQVGFPHQGSSSDLGSYEDEDDDNGVVPLVSTMLNEDVPSVGNGSSNQDGKINKDVGSPFREHDYIGLSDGGGSSSTTQDDKTKGKELDFGPKTKETELRLGPPPEAPEASFQKNIHSNLVKRAAEHHQVPTKPELNPAAAILPVDSDGRVGRPYALNDSLQRWNRQCFGEPHVGKYAYPKQTLISSKESSEPKFFNNGQEVHPHGHPHPHSHSQPQDYNNNGMAFLLTPKNTNTPTAGAKRVFSDAIGVAQVVRSPLNMPNEGSRMGLLMPATNAKSEVDSKVSSQQPQHQNQHHHQHQPPLPLMYPWANAVQVPNTWQVSLEQQQQQHRGSFGAFPTQAAARVMVGNVMAAAAGSITLNEAPHGIPSESRAKSSQESVSASAMRPPMPPPAPSERQQKNPTGNEALTPPSNGNGNSAASRVAPVVGWPPIRSFRKNLAPQPKPDIEDPTDASGNSYASTDPGQTFGDSMFVKVNMDGVPIGRKIDLKAYDSYDKLSQALEEMFKRFINVQGSGQRQPTNPSSKKDQPTLLSGTDYVLTYEDNEGDRMLVGDVPWDMFVSTVKRLRIMKSSEARGLAPRHPLKPQGQVTQ